MSYEEWIHLSPPPRTGRIQWRLGMWGAMFLAVVMTIAFGAEIHRLYTDYSLAKHGRVTEGLIIWNGPLLRGGYSVKYIYKGMPSGMEYAEGGVSSEPDEQPVDVTYLPDKPAVSRLGRPEDISLWLDVLFVIALAFFALITAMCAVGNLLIDCHLLRHGIETDGRITNVVKCKSRDSEYLSITYEFADSTGSIYRGSCTDDCVGDDLQAGQTIPVLYSPARPQRSSVYRFMQVKLLDQ